MARWRKGWARVITWAGRPTAMSPPCAQATAERWERCVRTTHGPRPVSGIEGGGNGRAHGTADVPVRLLYRQCFCCTTHVCVPKLTHMLGRAALATHEDHDTGAGRRVRRCHRRMSPPAGDGDSCRSDRLSWCCSMYVHVHDLLSLLKPTRAQESTLSYSDTRCMKLSELSR